MAYKGKYGYSPGSKEYNYEVHYSIHVRNVFIHNQVLGTNGIFSKCYFILFRGSYRVFRSTGYNFLGRMA